MNSKLSIELDATILNRSNKIKLVNLSGASLKNDGNIDNISSEANVYKNSIQMQISSKRNSFIQKNSFETGINIQYSRMSRVKHPRKKYFL